MGARSGAICGAVAGYLLLQLASCAGEDFSSKGSAGTGGSSGAQASGGSSGSSGACASSGAAGQDVGDCTSELYCKGCNQVSTSRGTCDECARTKCCNQALECMSDPACARLLSCFFKNCIDRSASVCIFDYCTDCLQNVGEFTVLAACIMNECKGQDAAADQCPQLLP